MCRERIPKGSVIGLLDFKKNKLVYMKKSSTRDNDNFDMHKSLIRLIFHLQKKWRQGNEDNCDAFMEVTDG